MKYTQGCYPIISKTALAKEIYDMTILCPDAAQAAQPGQFINIKVDGFMLRRPISICGIDKEKGTLRIVFEVRGKGTKELSQLAEGDLIDIIAPLGGNGFKLDGYNKAVIIGGGIGNPPMVPIAEHFGAPPLLFFRMILPRRAHKLSSAPTTARQEEKASLPMRSRKRSQRKSLMLSTPAVLP